MDASRASKDWHWIIKPVRTRISDTSFRTDVNDAEFFRILRVIASKYRKRPVRHTVSRVVQSGNNIFVVANGTMKCVTRRCQNLAASLPDMLVYREKEVKLGNNSLVSSAPFSESCLIEQLEIDWVDRSTVVVFEIKKYDDQTNYFCVFVRSSASNTHEAVRILKEIMAQ